MTMKLDKTHRAAATAQNAEPGAALPPLLAKRYAEAKATLDANPPGTPGHDAAQRAGLAVHADLAKLASEIEANRLIKAAHARPLKMGVAS